MSPHTTGVMLVVISAMVFSSAGVFTKAVESGAWEVIFWRGVFAAGFTVAYILWRGSFRQDFVAMGRSGWAVAII
ncbi:MAG: EamA family transporter, partial [Rhodospirillales bacterium]|nr:EamA family transporter [Rhodospirillales bacterium]